MSWLTRIFLGHRGENRAYPRSANDLSHIDGNSQAQYSPDHITRDEQQLPRDERVEREAEREVRSATANALKRHHVIQRGRCPQCGEGLRQHSAASICDSCGWFLFDAPRLGPVRVHLVNSNDAVVEGQRCYVVKTGAVLVLRDDVVVARVPATAVSWVEYQWQPEELERRRRQALERQTILCGWCNQQADPDADGFHLVQVAFGATQERYCLCSDECYEAFRKMYPARVHRNCYERSCSDCDLCTKRYDDDIQGVLSLAKDYLNSPRKR